jgi:hypothetical protein
VATCVIIQERVDIRECLGADLFNDITLSRNDHELLGRTARTGVVGKPIHNANELAGVTADFVEQHTAASTASGRARH